VLASVGLSGFVLLGIGMALTLFTGRSALASGTRQLVLGLAAAGITYLVGHVVGAALRPW
jgi:VIT1/CCC1 family predicted Fe2+/Mn2+ transporter